MDSFFRGMEMEDARAPTAAKRQATPYYLDAGSSGLAPKCFKSVLLCVKTLSQKLGVVIHEIRISCTFASLRRHP